MVRSVAAGSRLLTDEQARKLACVTREGDKVVASVEPSSYLMVWAGLAYNPVCPKDLIEQIVFLLKTTELPDPKSRNDAYDLEVGLARRLQWKPDPVTAPFDEVVDPKQLDWLVQRAADKRPMESVVTFANPALDARQRRTVLMAISEVPEWFAQLCRPYIERGLQLCPELASSLPEQYLGTPGTSRSHKVQQTTHVYELPAYQPDTGMHELLMSGAAVGWAADLLGDNPKSWEMFLSLAPDWGGTLGELLDTVTAIAA
jgi:hypothetical protein